MAAIATGPDRGQGSSSAAVFEFLCLFTHDLVRKQKRWQDGRLKYHTFNKRVMVYDDRGNYVGDMHWRADWELGDGEEFTLERGGVIVQVNEFVGRREQDLSELLDKPVQEKLQRQAKATSRQSQAPPMMANRPLVLTRAQPSLEHFQTPKRLLRQVIGMSTDYHGRALVPTESPFEPKKMAQQEQSSTDEQRYAKRRRQDEWPRSKGYAQSLFGQTLTLSAVPVSSASLRPAASIGRQGSIDRPSSSPSLQVENEETTEFSTTHVATQNPNRRRLSRMIRQCPCTHQVGDEAEDGLVDGLDQILALEPDRTLSVSDHCRQKSAARSTEQASSAHWGRNANQKPKAASIDNYDETLVEYDAQESEARVTDDISEQHKVSPRQQEISAAKPRTKSANPSSITEKFRYHAHEAALQREAAPKTKWVAEPRTELRLKSKKKRGLLMLSEQVNFRLEERRDEFPPSPYLDAESAHAVEKAPAREAEGHVDDAFFPPGSLPVMDPNPLTGQSGTADQSLDLIRIQDSNKTLDYDQVTRKRKHPTKLKIKNVQVSGRELDQSTSRQARAPSKWAMNQAKNDGGHVDPSQFCRDNQVSDEPGPAQERQEDLPLVPIGPRLAKIGSKSIKSREVIGYLVKNSTLHRPRLGTDFSVHEPTLDSTRQSSTVHRSEEESPRRAENADKDGREAMIDNQEQRHTAAGTTIAVEGEAVVKMPRPAAQLPDRAVAAEAPVSRKPRIQNPASRGRKAALQSDAAGLVPRSILPPDPAAVMAQEGQQKGSKTSGGDGKRPKRKMTFPGFASVGSNGGPWSREAHDLLAMDRPS